MKNKIVPETGISFKTIKIQGFKGNFRLIISKRSNYLVEVSNARRRSYEKPNRCSIGAVAAFRFSRLSRRRWRKIPAIVHEQSVPGITNKFLSRFANRVGISFQICTIFSKNKTVLLEILVPRSGDQWKVKY